MFDKEELEIIEALVNSEILRCVEIEKNGFPFAFALGYHYSILKKVRKM